MSHTPGPWNVEKEGDFFNVVCNQEGFNHYVVGNEGLYRNDGSDGANARLIAAAPDLLAALKLAFQALDAIGDEMTVGERYTNAGQYLIDSLNPARDAIKKAEGQS